MIAIDASCDIPIRDLYALIQPIHLCTKDRLQLIAGAGVLLPNSAATLGEMHLDHKTVIEVQELLPTDEIVAYTFKLKIWHFCLFNEPCQTLKQQLR
jgi:hypothetical protein